MIQRIVSMVNESTILEFIFLIRRVMQNVFTILVNHIQSIKILTFHVTCWQASQKYSFGAYPHP